ncbi:putative flagellar protein [Bacillus freudenreichii]|nr:putative flagellar protein [Bacillus freudenreichii]
MNAIYIETIESFPDTTITLTNGRKYVVAESEQLVTEKILKFYQSIQLIGRGQQEDTDEK